MNTKQNILILNSPLFRDKNPLYDEDSLPPIGLGIIATTLKNDGHEVTFIDAVADNIPLNDLISRITELNPDFVCANVFTTNLILVQELVERLQIHTRFILGSLATKDLIDYIFSWKSKNQIDVVHGDGERIIKDLVAGIISELPQKTIEDRRFYVVNTISAYYVPDISTEKLDRSFFKNEPVHHPRGFIEANIVTSRGCIYNCAFCAAARSVNSAMGTREKSIPSIILEIQHLISIYPGLQSIRILDDLFLKSPKSVEKAIEVFKNFNLKWRAMAHVETFNKVTPEIVKALRDSGCSELFIGIESGSPVVLRKIHKTSDLAKVKRNIALLLNNGINVKGYFIFGFPGETEADCELTYELAKYFKEISISAGTDFRTSVFQYRPYHGTELYHDIQSNEKETVDKIIQMKPNPQLSDLVGRLQFNFHTGNVSAAPIRVIQNYIYKTMNLNSLFIFGLDGSPKNCSDSDRKM